MLSAHEVTTAYQGLVAISSVSIEVAKGEIVCVAGANGAGKSTLLKSSPGRARAAAQSLRRARIDGMRSTDHARGIAYVPENRRLFPRLSDATIFCSAAISIVARRIATARWRWCSRLFRGCRNGRAARRDAERRRATELAIGRAAG